MCVYIRCSREKKFPSFPVFTGKLYNGFVARISRSFFCPIIGRFLEIFDSITNKEIECNLVSGDIDWSKRDYHQKERIRGCLSIDLFTRRWETKIYYLILSRFFKKIASIVLLNLLNNRRHSLRYLFNSSLSLSHSHRRIYKFSIPNSNEFQLSNEY